MKDPVDAISKSSSPKEAGASYEPNGGPELLRLIEQHILLAPEFSSVRAQSHAAAQPQSSGPAVSALPDEGPQPFGSRHETRQFWLPREAADPYGDPLPQEAFARLLREEQAPVMQAPVMKAPEATPEQPAVACTDARRTYWACGETAGDDYPGAHVSGPPDERPVALKRRGLRLIIAGLAGAALISILAAVAYYAPSASTTIVQTPVSADNIVEAKTTAAGQTVYGGELNQRAANTSAPILPASELTAPEARSDRPNNDRAINIRPDIEAADTSAAELNTSATVRARPGAGERPEVGTTSTSAAAFPDPRSELSTSPSSLPGADVEEQKKVRTSATPPQIAPRELITCQASAGSGGYWAWRRIDGRKCWYQGKSGMSKDNLRWGPVGRSN